MPIEPGITLQDHQERVRREAEEAARTGTPYRKLLYWGTGSGKSLGSLGAADALGAPATVVGPAALRQTLKGESLKALGHADFPISSYQAAAKGKVQPAETLLVDEAQRLNSPGSTQARAVSDLAEKARNVVLMSATPVRNRPSEFAPLMSILTGNPITHEEFANRYVGTETVRPGLLGRLRGRPTLTRPAIVNAEELKGLLAGKVDYHEPLTSPVPVTYKDVEAELKPRQASLYRGLFGKIPWVTRQKLKYHFPLTDDEMRRARSFMSGPRQSALSDYPYRKGGDPLKAFESSGKLTKAYQSLTDTLKDERAKAISYSNFPTAALTPMSAKLTADKIPHGVFHGKLTDEERRALVDKFNSGEHRVALVAPAGSEGISLRGAQKIQLLDKYWNSARNTQAQARGIRYDSHTGLPEDLKHVTVEQYNAKLPLRWYDRLLQRAGVDRERERETTDDYLERMAGKKDELNNQLLQVLKDSARAKKAEDDPRVKEVADNWYRPDGSSKTRATTQSKIRRTMEDYGLPLREAAELHEKAMLHYKDEHVVGGKDAYWELVRKMESGEWPPRPKEASDLSVGDLSAIAALVDLVPKAAAALTGPPNPIDVNHPASEVMSAVPLFSAAKPTFREGVRAGPSAGVDLQSKLRAAKEYSDRGAYQEKVTLLRELISADPSAWRVDSRQSHTVGVTHASGWRYHLPTNSVRDILPQADPAHASGVA